MHKDQDVNELRKLRHFHWFKNQDGTRIGINHSGYLCTHIPGTVDGFIIRDQNGRTAKSFSLDEALTNIKNANCAPFHHSVIITEDKHHPTEPFKKTDKELDT